MARGDGGKVVFENDEDRKGFLFRLGKVCESHGWRIHAWVLMDNHFHLLVETPEANLSSGMKLLLGSFSQGWNRRRLRRGHVFQGRYKSIPVNASDSDPYYFRIAADYIHLNPARSGLAGGRHGRLVDYAWSSLRDHARGKGPDWLESERGLRAFELAEDGRGRRAYVAWLEARAANEMGFEMHLNNKFGCRIGFQKIAQQIYEIPHPCMISLCQESCPHSSFTTSTLAVRCAGGNVIRSSLF